MKELGVIEMMKDPALLETMSLGDKLGGSLIVMVLGLLTCIVVLTVIMCVVKLMHRLAGEKKPKPIPVPASEPQQQYTQLVTSPLSGRVLSIDVKPGQSVASGDTLVTLEGGHICAIEGGIVKEIVAAAGAHVKAGDILLVL